MSHRRSVYILSGFAKILPGNNEKFRKERSAIVTPYFYVAEDSTLAKVLFASRDINDYKQREETYKEQLRETALSEVTSFIGERACEKEIHFSYDFSAIVHRQSRSIFRSW